MLYFTYFIFMFHWVSWKAILFLGGYLRIVGMSFWAFWEIMLEFLGGHFDSWETILRFLWCHFWIPLESFLEVHCRIYERSFLKKKWGYEMKREALQFKPLLFSYLTFIFVGMQSLWNRCTKFIKICKRIVHNCSAFTRKWMSLHHIKISKTKLHVLENVIFWLMWGHYDSNGKSVSSSWKVTLRISFWDFWNILKER